MGLRSLSLGYVGSIRITRRCDVDPTTMGWCTTQELPGSKPRNPGDILLIAKKRMADAEPYAVVVLMTQDRAHALELGFQQPVGVADRRPVTERVKKNIASMSPKCLKHGVISHDAHSYLSCWSEGVWPRQARPTAYNHLFHRRELPFHVNPGVHPSWEPPDRFKHVDLTYISNDAEQEDEGPSDDEPQAPIDM